MQLKTFSDEQLLQATFRLVKEEREILTSVLHHLREVERRRLFAKERCSSLFEFAVKRLGYSGAQAYRRISAMRLLKEMPELEEKIQSGALQLTALNLAQAAFRKRPCGKEDKQAVLQQLENTSTREAEKVIAAFAPSVRKPDAIRQAAPAEIELKFSANEALREKIETVKGLLAHKHPHLSLGKLLELLCDLGIQAWSKAEKEKPQSPAAPLSAPKVKSVAASRRAVFSQAKHQCQNCGSRYALEVEHCQPRALGGSNAIENLKLLCRSCNQRAAIEVFGIHKMEKYLEKRQT